ncbi:MAG TPA: hypothetical protein VJ440_13725 [Candidatus Brocadiaceae bacterium]|nr:hypothetical protein [Candidatus Brocadiaceae bacterium]
MMPFEKCPVCGSGLIGKEVEKLLRGGSNTAVLKDNFTKSWNHAPEAV